MKHTFGAVMCCAPKGGVPAVVVSCRCHANGDESRQNEQKLKREGGIDLIPFDQNLLIPLDLSRLRQIVIKSVSRLLTEGLLVRI